MHFLLSPSFAVLGFCVFLPWISYSVPDTAEPLSITTPTRSGNTTDRPTANGTTEISPSATTHITVTPTANNTTGANNTTVVPTSSHVTDANVTSMKPTGTTGHVTANATSPLTTSQVTSANDTMTSAKFSPTADHTTVASTTMVIMTSPGEKGKTSQFDPASFLGGIVLMLGLSVITFVAYRCYKNRRSSTPPYRVVDE